MKEIDYIALKSKGMEAENERFYTIRVIALAVAIAIFVLFAISMCIIWASNTSRHRQSFKKNKIQPVV